jgi:hypothetical protein
VRWGTNSVSGNEVAAARVPAHHALRHGAPLSCQSETSNRIPNLCVAPAVPMKNGCLRLYARTQALWRACGLVADVCGVSGRFRYAHGGSGDKQETAPVMAQWADCIWQMMRQFPTAFELNEAYLLELIEMVHVCKFGTFLFNTGRISHACVRHAASPRRCRASRACPTCAQRTELHDCVWGCHGLRVLPVQCNH